MIGSRARSCSLGSSSIPMSCPPSLASRRSSCRTGARYQSLQQGSVPPCQSVGRQLMSHTGSAVNFHKGEPQAQQLAAGAATSAVPHIIRGSGRSAEQLAEEIKGLLPFQHTVLAARVNASVADQLKALFPEAQYHPHGQLFSVRSDVSSRKAEKQPGTVGIVCGSSADEGVAEECRIAAAHIGCYAFKLSLSNLEALRSADVVIVVSDVDGALPAALAGAVESPVIAIPTSEAANANSLAPLLAATLSSSSPVSFVSIDDGLSAAAMAMRILRQVSRIRTAASASWTPLPSAAADRASSAVSPETHDVVLGPRCAWPGKKTVLQ